jgi:hypothetical protein
VRVGGNTHPGRIIEINPIGFHALNVPIPEEGADICGKTESHSVSLDAGFDDVACAVFVARFPKRNHSKINLESVAYLSIPEYVRQLTTFTTHLTSD